MGGWKMTKKMTVSDDIVTTEKLVTNLRGFRDWIIQPNGVANYTCLIAATRLLELEEFLRIRDAYLVDRGLWEDFCESVEKTDD
jgi:hypothetical protein